MGNPILTFDLILASRRSHPLAARCLFGGVLLAELLLLMWLLRPQADQATLGAWAEFWLAMLVLQHFALLAILTLASCAGMLAGEKAAGTLELLLTTQLSPWEIVTGKLLAQGLRVLALLSVALPLFCAVGGLIGAVTLPTLLRLLAASAALIFSLGAFSLWISNRSDSPRAAATFLLTLVGVVVGVGTWLLWHGLPWLTRNWGELAWVRPWVQILRAIVPSFNPLLVLEPDWGSARSGRFTTFLWVNGILGLTFLLLTVVRLRAETLRALDRNKGRPRWLRRSQRVDPDDPIRWREHQLGSGWIRFLQAVATAWITTELAAWWVEPLRRPWSLWPLWLLGGTMLALLVGIRASGSISGERERQTWQSLLITPLDTWEILIDKRRGVLLAYAPVLLAFALPMLVESFLLGWEPGLLGLGLLLWVLGANVFMASLGLMRSAESRGPWQPLVSTVLRGSGYFFAWAFAVAFALAVGYLLLTVPVLDSFLWFLGVPQFLQKWGMLLVAAAAVLLAWRLCAAANLRLWYAQEWINAYERYGRTLTRSLTRALLRHYQRLEDQADRQAEREAESHLADSGVRPEPSRTASGLVRQASPAPRAKRISPQ